MDPKPTPTLAERAAAFATAANDARGAPFIPSGLRDALASVADFAAAVVAELTELRETSTANEAAMLEKIAELEARIN